MNRLLYLAAGSAVFALASCSQDIPDLPSNDGMTTFNLTLADAPSTRAFGEGTSATRLSYVVYEKGVDTPVTNGWDQTEVKFTDNKATLNLKLVNGVEYDIVFFASNLDANCYTFDATTKQLTVSYNGATGNDDSRDAFFGSYSTGVVNGGIDADVTLTRPFAQVNLGSDDLSDNPVNTKYPDGVYTKLTAKGVANTLNLLTGEASGEADATFALAKNSNEKFPLDTEAKSYAYLSMNYILVPAERSVVDVTAEFHTAENSTQAAHSISVPNLPMQRNFRTNVYGSLLSSNGNFDITVNPGWGEGDINLKWDGVTTDTKFDKSDKEGEVNVYLIKTAAQLAGLAKLINTYTGNAYDFKDNVYRLEADIDLDNQAWNPIGNFKTVSFTGSFDGNGHTIRNLRAVAVDNSGGDETAGLFGAMSRQTGDGKKSYIKNVTIDGATVSGSHYAGVVVGHTNSGVDISGCTVKNATVTSSYKDDNNSGDKAGGIAGYFYGGAMTGCTVENVVVTAARDCGGLVGMLQINSDSQKSTVSATGNTIRNVTVIANNASVANNSGTPTIGAVDGRRAAQRVTENNNTVENVTLKLKDIDVMDLTDNKQYMCFNGIRHGVSMEFENVKTRGIYASWQYNNTKNASLTVRKCVIIGDENKPTDNKSIAYLCRTGIQFFTGNSTASSNKLTVEDTNISNSWSHGIMCHKNGNFTLIMRNNNISNWGRKEESKYDVETSAAIKVYDSKYGESEKGRNALADIVFSSGNRFTPATDKQWNYTILNITNDENGKFEYVATSKDDMKLWKE